MESGQKTFQIAKSQKELEDLCWHPGIHVNSDPLDDVKFEKVSKSMVDIGLLYSWTARPRTYFILHQIGRCDLMALFVMQGFDDGSLPYANRGVLPKSESSVSFNPQEAEDFLRWQSVCYSPALRLEKGEHCRFPDGDILFISERSLGQGSANTSVVDKVVSKATRKVYARKRIRRDKFPKEAQKAHNRELQNLKKVGEHVHLIKVRASYTDKKYFGLLLEPVAEENFKTYLLRVSAVDNPEVRAQLCSYYGCMANVMLFLHGTMLLHKDVKLENFLISKGRLILTDFGTSFDWSKSGQSMTLSNANDARTPRYISPEVAKESQFHRASDIWSLGVVFLEMTTVLRGETLPHLEHFLVHEDGKTSQVWANVPAARRWMQKLIDQPGPPDDNEPLAWTRRMLDPIMDNRPSALDLYSNIVTFQMGRFCGSCCTPNEHSDASSQSDLLESDDEPTLQPHHIKYATEPAYLDRHVPGAFPVDVHNQRDSDKDLNPSPHDGSGHAIILQQPGLNAGNSSHFQEKQLKTEQATDQMDIGPQIRTSTQQAKPFARRGPRGILGWLTSYRTPRPRPALESREPTVTMQSQRVNHFLNTLPPRLQMYEAMPNQSQVLLPFSDGTNQKLSQSESADIEKVTYISQLGTERYADLDNVESSPSTQIVKASGASVRLLDPGTVTATLAMSGKGRLPCRRLSNPSAAPGLNPKIDHVEDTDNSLTRLVHFPSDGDLRTASGAASQDFVTTIADLKATRLQISGSLADSSSVSQQLHEVGDATNAKLDVGLGIRQGSTEQAVDTNPKAPIAPVLEHEKFDNDEVKTSAIQNSDPHSKARNSANEKRKVRFSKVSEEYLSQNHPPSTLASYVNQVSNSPRQWESASTVMKRILKDKASVAATSEMSARTRKVITQSRPLLCWNDKTYNYLSYFVQEGKVQAVRELLSAGCNPGTKEKPRKQPVLFAIKGRTHKHNKCLLELLRAQADAKAVGSNGKTYLHYAVSQPSWSGYSTTVYLLLMHGVELNRADAQGVVPFVQLLLGNGPLTMEEREALLLLLAPNFDARIDGLETTLADNVLHLAIRRKDPYALDAILSKATGNVVKDKLFSKQNASGFTPIMLVMNSFTFKDREESDIGLRLLQLLLEAGADPDSQDKSSGNRPLCLAIGTYRNLGLVNLLLQHNADPTLHGSSQKSAGELLADGTLTDPNDVWYSSLSEMFKSDQRWFPQSKAE